MLRGRVRRTPAVGAVRRRVDVLLNVPHRRREGERQAEDLS